MAAFRGGIAGYLTFILAGLLLFSSPTGAFAVLVISTVVLLVVSLRNTWDLLVTVGDVTMGGDAS